jgi:predicted transcriptional regulator
MKLTSEQLSDVVIESLTLSVALLERLETMQENGLLAMKAKQSLTNVIPHLENYVNKLIKAHEEDEIEHMQKAATVISELSSRMESALSGNNILDISERKNRLKEMIEECPLFPVQKTELYEKIKNSGILEY